MFPGRHAQVAPDRPAVVMSGGEVLTYGELEQRSCRLARLLYAAGLRAGDVVAVAMENRTEYFEVCWAALRSGLYVTTVSTHLTAGEAAYIVDDSGAAAFVASARTAQVARAIVPDTPRVAVRLMVGGSDPDHQDYVTARDRYPAEPLDVQPLGDFMLYSSGTTGRPKGIRRPLSGRDVSEGNAVLQAALGPLYGITDRSVYLSPAPLYHSAPLQYSTSAQGLGATVVVMEEFDAQECLALIDRLSVTHAQFVPTMFLRMLKLPPEIRASYRHASLSCVLHAAAPCPVQTKRDMIDWWGPILTEYYAGTEGAGATSISSPEWLQHPGSVGRPMYAPAHICADDGRELPVGQDGLVYFESPSGAVPFEYHRDPAKTRASQHPEHPSWSTLGDVGHLDADGYLYLTDRKAYVIVSGGVNVYPQEAEDLLTVHPDVADAAVFGVPDPDFGEAVKAVVQLLDPAKAGPDMAAALLRHCTENLSRIKCPRSVDFSAELPRLPNGKLYKRLLRDRYWAGHQSRING